MNARTPFLEISGPEGQRFTYRLAKDQVTVGRLREFNDVVLDPDPQQLITRAHCAVERNAGAWWVVDNGSTNGTFVRQGKRVRLISGRESITDGDAIRILGKLTDSGEPLYWDLIFRDPLKTSKLEQRAPITTYLEYDWVQARLFRVSGANTEEISALRPQEHKIIRYMDHRNRSNGSVPVVCMYEEIISAVWSDEPVHTESEVNRLIWELRQKIEPDPKSPQFLQTVRGLGYRLVTGASNT